MSTPEQTGEPVHVEGPEQFETYVAENPVVLVDYHADWCGPCKMLEPTVAELAAETDVLVLKVDIDELTPLAQERGIRSVPTLEFYADGEMAERLVGVQSRDDLARVIDRLS
jgi:thioredoxin 1